MPWVLGLYSRTCESPRNARDDVVCDLFGAMAKHEIPKCFVNVVNE